MLTFLKSYFFGRFGPTSPLFERLSKGRVRAESPGRLEVRGLRQSSKDWHPLSFGRNMCSLSYFRIIFFFFIPKVNTKDNASFLFSKSKNIVSVLFSNRKHKKKKKKNADPKENNHHPLRIRETRETLLQHMLLQGFGIVPRLSQSPLLAPSWQELWISFRWKRGPSTGGLVKQRKRSS